MRRSCQIEIALGSCLVTELLVHEDQRQQSLSVLWIQQDRAFEPSQRRRVLLSTNVAETSVTLPGVRAVIDSGLVRRTIYREGRGALTLTPIAADAADIALVAL